MERNLKKLKQLKRLLAVVLCFLLTIGILPSSALAAPSSTEQTNYAFPATLKNPVIKTDTSMTSGQSVTWDYVWFGSYPQSEVESTDSVLYSQLQAASGWDSNNDITLDGTKYRRMKKDDATHTKSGSNNYYNWSDDATYHYFKYEPIKWRVLEVKDGNALLLADIALDDQKYNTNNESVTWETSSMRSWLNGYDASKNQPNTDYTSKNFINSAFTQKEKDAILTTTLENKNNLTYHTPGGSNTEDKVFLLSESDVYTDSAMLHGFVSSKDTKDEARRCKSSTYAKAMGVWSSTAEEYEGNCYWWLRSPGYDSYCAALVSHGGYGDDFDDVYSDNYGARPALYLNLASLIYLSNNSTDESWKLAMNDSTKTVALNTTGEVGRQGNVVTVRYTYSGSDINQISVMITDKEYGQTDAKIGYYGALQGATTSGDMGTGTGTFTLPEAYANKTCGKDYYAYIMAETVNENTENYTSNPVSISVPDSKTSTTTTLLSDCGSEVTYGDSYTITAQANVGDAKIDDAVVAYYTDKDCTTGRTTTKPTNAGTYYVRGEYAGNNTYAASNSAVFTLKIKKKEVTATWQGDLESTYDGTEKSVTATLDGLIETDKSNVTLAYTNDATNKNEATNVGSYVAKASLSGNAAGNYALKGADQDGYITTNWKINSKGAIQGVTIDNITKTYDGVAVVIDNNSLKGTTDGVTVKSVVYKDASGKEVENPTNAGTYTATVTLAETGYDDTTLNPVTITISKKEVTAKWQDTLEFTYDGDEKSVEATLSGVLETDKANVTLAYTNNTTYKNEATNVGSYVASASLSGSASENYALKGADKDGNISTTWEITQADISDDVTLDASGMDKSYDGKVADASAAELSGYPEIDTNESVEYYTADGQTKLENAPIDAGTYTIKVTVTDPDGNYKPVEKNGYVYHRKEKSNS